MESVLSNSVTFAALQTRLIGFVNMRIQNGEYTERGLARLLGISQPQIHHVLKGIRRPQPEFADRIMARFGVTVLDLLEDGELNTELKIRQSRPGGLRWFASASSVAEPGASVEEPRRKPAGSSDALRPAHASLKASHRAAS